MPNGRYYSRGAVSALLASLVGPCDGRRILDLCSGGGALVDALAIGHRGTGLVSVDSDPGTTSDAGTHVVADALSPDLDAALGFPAGFDVVLCNPPYGTIPDAPHIRQLAESSGIPHPHADGRLLDAAWAFSAQAIRLARPGGIVALVLPDGLATGLRSAPFRRALLARHAVTHVVSLPENAFDDTRASAFLLILRKDATHSAPVLLSAMARDGTRGADLPVSPESAARRLDHAFHAVMGPALGPSLASLGGDAVRGRIDPRESRERPGSVFHTSSFPSGEARRGHALPAAGDAKGHAFLAGAGDILLARVHRSLHTKVCLIATGEAPPTSFVLRLRLPPRLRAPVLDALISPEGETRLKATARGTGARTLAAADLMSMPLPLAVPFQRG